MRAARALIVALVTIVVGFGITAVSASVASAHVVPTSTVQLAIEDDSIDAAVTIPLSDLTAASGIDLGGGSPAEVGANAGAITAYLVSHVRPTTDTGTPWTVAVTDLTSGESGDRSTTGRYRELEFNLVLTPPPGGDLRDFDLGWTAVVDRVATHVVLVTVGADWAGGQVSSPSEIGTVQRDTVTDTVRDLHVDLGDGGDLRGMISMVRLGVSHIAEGTDHQLFLLTLLLPAPLLVAGGRWRGVVGTRQAFRRIGVITFAFTVGHSTTLALGASGVPVPQHVVEAAIAVSILVAALHAFRPIFPGREAVVAAGFGLVHGLAFSQTLRELDLSGSRLVLSLLGFNLGIELMQLIIVAAVLPALVLLAGAGRYQALRKGLASLTALAAVGWLLARVGLDNPVATAADHLAVAALPTVALLWIAAGSSWLARLRPTRDDRSVVPTDLLSGPRC